MYFSHKSLQLKGQNLLQEDVTSSLMLVGVMPPCRGISVGSVPEATVGSRAACRLWERRCTRTCLLTLPVERRGCGVSCACDQSVAIHTLW